MAEINEPACGCNGCQMVALGRETHHQIQEMRRMIDQRDERLNRIYNVAGNIDNVPSVASHADFPDRYPGGRY